MLVLRKHNLQQASHHFCWLANSLSFAAERREGKDVSQSWRPCRACTMGLIALEWHEPSLVLSCFFVFFFCFSIYYLIDLYIFSLFGSETRLVLEARSSTQEYECNLVMRLKNKDSMVDHFCTLTWKITCNIEPLWGIHIYIYKQ